jgi:phage repressor protein C with HTH and peptisase S24 domain
LGDSSGKRLASFRESLGLSQRVFAASLGVSGGLVGQIEADIGPPSRRVLQALSERYGLSADWLLNGSGEMLHPPKGFGEDTRPQIVSPNRARPMAGDFSTGGEEFSLIRRLDLDVSAGSGLIPVDGGEAEMLAFSRSWLARNQVSADLSALVRVKGDSMSPGIPNGALVLVHVAETEVRREGIYAFSRDGASYIKRITPVRSNKDTKVHALLVASDNAAFAPELLTENEMNEIRIIGRIRCVLTTL